MNCASAEETVVMTRVAVVGKLRKPGISSLISSG